IWVVHARGVCHWGRSEWKPVIRLPTVLESVLRTPLAEALGTECMLVLSIAIVGAISIMAASAAIATTTAFRTRISPLSWVVSVTLELFVIAYARSIACEFRRPRPTIETLIPVAVTGQGGRFRSIIDRLARRRELREFA